MKRIVAVMASLLSASQAICGDAPKKSSASKSWLDSLAIDGYLSGGVAINFALPFNKINFGHLETDRANWPQFNQAILNVERPLDKKAADLDFGLCLHRNARHGRPLHPVPGTNRISHSRSHAAFDRRGESQDPSSNPDRRAASTSMSANSSATTVSKSSHRRTIFSIRAPLVRISAPSSTRASCRSSMQRTGSIFTQALSPASTPSIGWPGDNNNSPSIHAGFGLNLLDGDLSILAITHSGPENPNVKDPLLVGWPDGVIGGVPAACACNPNNAWTMYNNLTATWNATENLSFASDISYFRESG